jgi:RNA polymerase sigma-70 factor (ECF subfamily)
MADLASTFGPRIQQLALRYVKNWEDAEEVTQDVLMKVYRKIDAFRGDAALSSWIYRITFNTAMSRLRSTRASRATEVQKPDLASQDPSERTMSEPADWSSLADDHVLRGEMRERLIQSLTELPTVYRVPVILRDIQGLSTEEASAVLKVKPQTLKSRLHRGRLMLRERLADFAGGVMMHARESLKSEVGSLN